MAKVPWLTGPSNVQVSLALDPQEAINLFGLRAQVPGQKVPLALQARPVLRPWAKAPSGPVRGMFTDGNGRAWAACGATMLELQANRTLIPRGSIAVDANPVTFAYNGQGGHQVLSTSGGNAYIFDTETDTFTQVVDASLPTTPILRCEFLAAKFILQFPTTNQFFYSAEFDGNDWNALDFFEPSLTSDVKTAMLADHGVLWLWGRQRTEVWQPTGEQNTAYAPIAQTIIEQGIASDFSPTRADNTTWWVQGDERGNRHVVKANGYNPEIVSTDAVSYYLGLQSQSQIQQTLGYAFQIEGHAFYGLMIPSAPFALLYQIDTGQWWKWAHWDVTNLVWRVFRSRNAIFCFGKHLLGDTQSGTIFELSFEHEADAFAV